MSHVRLQRSSARSGSTAWSRWRRSRYGVPRNGVPPPRASVNARRSRRSASSSTRRATPRFLTPVTSPRSRRCCGVHGGLPATQGERRGGGACLYLRAGLQRLRRVDGLLNRFQHRSHPCLQSPLHPMTDLRMLSDFCYHRTHRVVVCKRCGMCMVSGRRN